MSNTVAEQTTEWRSKLADYYLKNETDLVRELLSKISLSEARRLQIESRAAALIETIRKSGSARSQIDNLLQEYGLSTDEGVMLMRLSEALIRTPDFATSRTLIRDKIGDADWSSHAGRSDSFWVNQATTGLRMTSGWITATGGTQAKNLLAKLGDRVMERAMTEAMGVMGNHFVLGRNIKEACERAKQSEADGFAHSYDMLGEAAYTHADAQRYFDAYLQAVQYLAKHTAPETSALQRAGLSIKLSALHPRYEYAKREECVPVLMDRVSEIARIASREGLWLNIDAEEADRLEISVEIFDCLLHEPSLENWPGLGLVVQAYQRRAAPLLDHVEALARARGRQITIRLVKGAYWDMEIKRAQELGLSDYPVFTRKENTDVSYLACAQKLLNFGDHILPQFATHNAHTAVAIAHMAPTGRTYEFQRLHGMGADLHDSLFEEYGVQSRIYAPVGSHKDLLPYLVRRLLENGANGSFVNQMLDEDIPARQVAADPIALVESHGKIPHPKIPRPLNTVETSRVSASGIDLTQSDVAASSESLVASGALHDVHSVISGENSGSRTERVVSPQDHSKTVGTITCIEPDQVSEAIEAAQASDWAIATTAASRAEIFDRAADLLEQEMPSFLELCIREAGKALPDAVAEVREAVDFCRYYARQAQGPNIIDRAPLGTVACISPWNFPLAIFLGQVVAALSVGNTVIAKPAAQTPIIAAKAVDLLFRAGVPTSALQLLLGDGAALGNAMSRHPDIAGICFTGSTRTAKIIASNLADTGRADTPFIAETGGINAMIVDSTALLEQAVQDVVNAAFQSAGQRCSACRIVCVQSDVADAFLEMLTGAMATLTVGDPAKLTTDVGPVIDAGAQDIIESYKADARAKKKIISEIELGPEHTNGYFVGPALLQADRVSDVQREIFGPVLHFVRFEAKDLYGLVAEINSLGFGLTLGLHTRVDDRVSDVAARAHVGNIYVNRNQIGAVVGVQPFGGEGLSGTGPKAGGPHYLFGLTQSTQAGIRQTGQTPPPAMDAASIDKERVEDLLAKAKTAATAWQTDTSVATRAETVGTLLGRDLSELTYADLTPLPGPTGEKNTLRLCPRGVMLCFGGDTDEATRAQVARALIAGSSVLLAGRTLSDSDLATVEDMPEFLIQHISTEEGLALIDTEIDGLAADGTIRLLVAAKTCRRDGPILTVLKATDPIERFLHERTLTIDTTAAGGNASLLALD